MEIVLNVYDIEMPQNFCCPVYHTGVVAGIVEYSFGASQGIYESEPRSIDDMQLSRRLFMGTTEKSSTEIRRCLDNLRDRFRPDNYDVLDLNCNHFSSAFCKSLLGKDIPSYINRISYWAGWFSCLRNPPRESTFSQSGPPKMKDPLLGGIAEIDAKSTQVHENKREKLAKAALERMEVLEV